MKNEKICYVLIREENGKILYLTIDNDFTDSVFYAVKAENRITAKLLLDYYYDENQLLNIEIPYDDFKIMPLKVTYEM